MVLLGLIIVLPCITPLLAQGRSSTGQSTLTISDHAEWPITDVGSKLMPQEPDAALKQMLSEIDPLRIKKIIEKLVSFGTRHTCSSQDDPERGIGAARDWIESEMRAIATQSGDRMTVSVPKYVQGRAARIPFPVTISNVVARLEGTSDPSRVYVISGHYDSRNSGDNDYEGDSPGANDDASGVAVVMELARIMASKPSQATIIFTAVAGEEQSLYGSAFLAQTLKNSSTNVEAMLNNDIVGSSVGDKGQKDPYTIRLFAQGLPTASNAQQLQQMLRIGAENDSPTRQLARFALEVGSNSDTGMNVAVIYRLDRYGRGGDHSSFLQQGYPAVRFTEPNEDFAHQHQDVRMEGDLQYGDLPQFVDFEYVARVAKVNMATLWSLANSPGAIPNAKFDPSLSNKSKMSWTTPKSGKVAGYEIVWRPTDAAQWSHVLPVGKVVSATIPLSRDNVIFGVRAIGANGYKGPVTVPGVRL
jgi:hypothetical protein